ncbi:MAG: nicotinamide riboside transporter PnuC [Bacteroidales bacterium]
MLNWLFNNYIELIGTIAGLIYLYLEIKQNFWLWPLGFITSAFYVYIFYVSKFYADMGLQVYYLIVSVYGLYHWLYGGKREKMDSLPVTCITKKLVLWLSLVTVVLFFAIEYILEQYTDSPIPIGDAFTTALSITATWMLARKIIEHWWLWVIINSVSLGLYIYKGLYPTSVLFVFYTTMSVVGYYQWRKVMSTNNNQLTTIN